MKKINGVKYPLLGRNKKPAGNKKKRQALINIALPKFKPMKVNWKPLKRMVSSIFSWLEDSFNYVKAHWPRYMLSFLTGTFTFQAAYIMTGEAYYAVMAVLLAEGMFLYWLSRFDAYENASQKTVVMIMFVTSCIAIFLTDMASAVLIVNNNDQEQFISVMPAWVVWVIMNSTPYLSASNLVAYGLFEFFSDTARDKREHSSQHRNVDRIVKASKRDSAKLRSRMQVLRVQRNMTRIETKHQRMFGRDMVEKVNNLMKLELMDMEVSRRSFYEWLVDTRNAWQQFKEAWKKGKGK